MPSWPGEENKNDERARIAKALGRQDFWKAAYLAATRYLTDSSAAVVDADIALAAFDAKFGGDLCPTTSST
ncbi:hypothetical protein D3C87_1751760 [compost metagenome]